MTPSPRHITKPRKRVRIFHRYIKRRMEHTESVLNNMHRCLVCNERKRRYFLCQSCTKNKIKSYRSKSI